MIHLNQNSIKYLIGEYIYSSTLDFNVFDEYIVDFFDALSKELMKSAVAKKYPDVTTFAFYVRKANVNKLKEQYFNELDGVRKLGRGLVFHIAPSNVPVNFAYSLFASLICGNKNIVKVSSKDFDQVGIICDAIKSVLNDFNKLNEYITIVRYNNEKEVTDYFSSICDVRVVWGGDNTINYIKQSAVKPRCREVLFADRYSLLVIDSNYYNVLSDEEKTKIAHNVYNDTYLSDQNACTSPRLICFIGDKNVNDEFYDNLQKEVISKYTYKPIFTTNKLLDSCKFAINTDELEPKIIFHDNKNIIIRIIVDKLSDRIIDNSGNTGLFVESSIESINELKGLCNDDRVQTITYVGDKKIFNDLLDLKLSGIDRIVPAGESMDFNLIWDGYNLVEMFTRNIKII